MSFSIGPLCVNSAGRIGTLGLLLEALDCFAGRGDVSYASSKPILTPDAKVKC